MLVEASATRFMEPLGTGRNKPALISAIDARGGSVDLVIKHSAGNIELGVEGLIAEGLAGLLACDLGLPIPQPYIIRLTPEFIASIQASTPTYAALFRNSCSIAYGSCYLKGYRVVSQAWQPPAAMLEQIAEIAAFDAIVQNPDRLPKNPNCLQSGKRIAIIDHELAFTHIKHHIFGWQPPWKVGGLSELLSPAKYLFGTALRNVNPNFVRFRNAWTRITDERLNGYLRHLPPEWIADGRADYAGKITDYMREARNQMDSCLLEVKRAIGG